MHNFCCPEHNFIAQNLCWPECILWHNLWLPESSSSLHSLCCPQCLFCTFHIVVAMFYGRIPNQMETLSEANASICSQRMLDPVLMNISQQYNNNLNFTSWTYFGSVEGVHRAFPGRVCPPFPHPPTYLSTIFLYILTSTEKNTLYRGHISWHK